MPCHSSCGLCCSNLFVWDMTEKRMAELAKRADPIHEDARFIAVHWKTIPNADATVRIPWAKNVLDRLGKGVPVLFYRCDLYDEKRRRCTGYDIRPPICRDFPHYAEKGQDLTDRLSPGCGYGSHQHGRQLIEIQNEHRRLM